MTGEGEDGTYHELAQEFIEESRISDLDVDRVQKWALSFGKLEEEVDELDKAIGLLMMRRNNEEVLYQKDPFDTEEEIAKEMADVIGAMFVMAEWLDIDLEGAYSTVMSENIQSDNDNITHEMKRMLQRQQSRKYGYEAKEDE